MKKLLLIPFQLFFLLLTAQQNADIIIINGKIATMVKAGEFKQAVAIKVNDIRTIHSLCTIVNGKPVYGEGDYLNLNREAPAVIPEWSPVKYYGGYQQ